MDTTPAVLRKSPPTLVGPEYVAAQIKRQRELEEQAKQLAEADAKKKKFTVQQAFSSEQEAEQIIMDKLKRKLVPLEYTEEEQQSVGRSNIPQADKKKKSIKSLIEHIPTTRDELFGYKIEWSVVDEVCQPVVCLFVCLFVYPSANLSVAVWLFDYILLVYIMSMSAFICGVFDCVMLSWIFITESSQKSYQAMGK